MTMTPCATIPGSTTSCCALTTTRSTNLPRAPAQTGSNVGRDRPFRNSASANLLYISRRCCGSASESCTRKESCASMSLKMARSAVPSAYFRVRGETSDGRPRSVRFFLHRLLGKDHLVPTMRVSELQGCNRSSFDPSTSSGQAGSGRTVVLATSPVGMSYRKTLIAAFDSPNCA